MDKEDVTHIYNGILLSHKRNETELFVVRWMDLESVIWNEVSQKEKKQIPYANTYIWNLKKKKKKDGLEDMGRGKGKRVSWD